MKKQVFDYFVNLDKIDAEREGNAIIFDADKRKQTETQSTRRIKSYDIFGVPCYMKGWKGDNSVFSVATSQMLNDLGIINPPENVFKLKGRKIWTGNFALGSQDAFSAQEIEVISASKSERFKSIMDDFFNGEYKWDILTNRSLRFRLLTIMTEDCLDDLRNMYILDELRTECDRHLGNFFFYRTPGAKKFEGIMPIDHEAGLICTVGRNGFINLQHFPYVTITPSRLIDNKTYRERIDDLKDIIQEGFCEHNQIEFLKRALSYDFPEAIKNVYKKYNVTTTAQNPHERLYDAISTLWEYNHTQLSDELEL